MKKQKCRACGCTDDRACEGGCYWVEYDLCSACAPKLEAAVKAVIHWHAMTVIQTLLEPEFRMAKLEAVDKLRVLPKGIDLDGRKYRAIPSRQEIEVRSSPLKKGPRR